MKREQRERMNIAFATDDNYVMPTAVAMASLFENNPFDIDIYLLSIDGHLSSKNKGLLRECVDSYGQNIRFADLSLELFDGLPILRHGLSTYLRLFAPVLFPEIDKMLYLDADIVVDGSIVELYNTDIEEFQFAGSADQASLNKSYLHEIGFEYKRPYVNAGVLLMNLKALRGFEIKDLMCSYVDKYHDFMQLGDQDIINCIFPDIRIIHPKYNALPLFWIINSSKRGMIWGVEEIKETGFSPVIIHYITPKKPWKLGNAHVHRDRWFFYLAKTPFKGYRPKVTVGSIPTVIKGFVRRCIKKIIKRRVLNRYRQNKV
ncbi:MAG: glycosyltransferase family 8 protein [Rikenellaceae bacterium]